MNFWFQFQLAPLHLGGDPGPLYPSGASCGGPRDGGNASSPPPPPTYPPHPTYPPPPTYPPQPTYPSLPTHSPPPPPVGSPPPAAPGVPAAASADTTENAAAGRRWRAEELALAALISGLSVYAAAVTGVCVLLVARAGEQPVHLGDKSRVRETERRFHVYKEAQGSRPAPLPFHLNRHMSSPELLPRTIHLNNIPHPLERD
jgi:hypothetical protein